MLRPLLFAFGFESLPMLGWLAAATAPWLIHLFSRRKHHETAWAAMDFLLAAVRRRSRRIQIEQWLVLLVRTLVIVLLVAAVAEPYREQAVPVFSRNGSTHRVLVIDSSYSMAYKTADRTRFEQAKQAAARIVEQSSPGDGFTLIQMASPPRAIVATPGSESGPILQEIQNLELLHTGADLTATLAEVRKVLDTAKRDSPRLTHPEVYFFTDMQKGTWMPAMSDASQSELHRRAEELASIAQLEIIDLGEQEDDNLAVTSLDLREAMVLVGRNVVIEAAVRDFGRIARQRQAVDLLVDSRPAGRQYIDIPAGGNAVARFNTRFESNGDHAVEVRLVGDLQKRADARAADALEVDNHRYVVVNVRQTVRVLCVDGRPAGDRQKSSVFNLELALSSRSDPNSRSPIKVDVAGENAVLERKLGDYDCVMLSDVAQFTTSEARVLEDYLLHGGSLVFFMGERVNAANYNSVLASPARGESRQILPARLIAVAKNPGGSLDPRDYRHPIVQKFRGQEKAGLLRSPIDQYFKVQLGETASNQASPYSGASRKAEVALALGNGDPLIVTDTIGRGRVALVTTSADATWSPLPKWGTYEPLVKEILAWCTAGQAQPRNFEVGEPLEATISPAPPWTSVSIERPGGQSRSMPLDVQGDEGSWRYDDTLISGIYTAHGGPPLEQNQIFAVNLVTTESDLTRTSRDELQNEAWAGIPLGYETSWQGEGAALPTPAATAWPFHVGLFYAVVALLLLESILAWRFGYNGR